MRLLVCGVRGSTPAPGPEFVRYGGHTSCVAVAHDGKPPSLVLDGGTGLRRLARTLGTSPFRGTVLLSHLHWDHTQGLPFFGASAHPASRTRVLLPEQGDAETVLGRALSPPHFPLRPSELHGRWSFRGLEAGEHEVDSFVVTALDIPHGGGRTFGYRVSDGKTVIAYMSDHSPIALGRGPAGLGPYHPAALALADGADLLLHDSQHTSTEFPEKAFLGHSAVDYAVGLAEAAGVRRLLLYHHDPDRSDDEIDALVGGHQRPTLEVDAAAEGAVLDVPDRARD